MASNEEGRDGPAGPQPSRGDKRLYFVLMAICIGLFVLAWAVLDRYYGDRAAVAVSLVALVIPPVAVIIANAASATDRRRG